MRAIVLAASAGFFVASCTQLWGVDDLTFTPASSSSSASTGGDGGTAGGGTGGGDGGTGGSAPLPCNDRIDVQPMIIDQMVGPAKGPGALAARNGMVGSVWQIDNTTMVVLFNDTNGTLLHQDGTTGVANLPEFRPTITAADDYFAIAFPRPADVEVRIFDRLDITNPDPVRLFVTPPNMQGNAPKQVSVTTGPNNSFFLTVGRDPDRLFHALVTGPPWMSTEVQPFTADTACCCAERSFAATTLDTFHVAWSSACGDSTWQFESFDASGTSAGTAVLTGMGSASGPEFAYALDQTVVLASCNQLLRVAVDGSGATGTSLPGLLPGSCALVSTGHELRWATNDVNGLSWQTLDPMSGPGGVLLTMSMPFLTTPLAAYDGSGFALMWPEANDVGYAHIACQ